MQSLTASSEASHSNARFSTSQDSKSLRNQSRIYGAPASARTHTGNGLVAAENCLVDIPQVNGNALVNVGNSNHGVMAAPPDGKRTPQSVVTVQLEEGIYYD
jgi:histidine ammonia-lyase